jgi:hypothetical protein
MARSLKVLEFQEILIANVEVKKNEKNDIYIYIF